jgi:hypothetical protein
MANVTAPEERDAIIQDLLDRTSLPREVVEEMVAISLGESVGDIVPVPPPSDDERRHIGPSLTMEEALEWMHLGPRSSEPIEPPVVTTLDPEERAAVVELLFAATNIPAEQVDEEIDGYLSGRERISGRLVLPSERRLMGRHIEQALAQRRSRSVELAASGEHA